MKGILVIILCIIAAGFAIPERIVIPVVGATPGDWNRKSFWHESWACPGSTRASTSSAAWGQS